MNNELKATPASAKILCDCNDSSVHNHAIELNNALNAVAHSLSFEFLNISLRMEILEVLAKANPTNK